LSDFFWLVPFHCFQRFKTGDKEHPMTPRFAAFGACLVAAAFRAQGEALATPLPEPRATVLLEGMPSFHQRNSEFPGGGKNFCGPTAASNALMWLANRGYPQLKPAGEDDTIAQKEMIKRLAGFMGTYREGTSVDAFICGINSYLRTVGYSSKSWTYSGNSRTSRTRTPPDVSLVNAMATGNTVLWFSLGWYAFDETHQKYTRDFGHWVTLVGYGRNRDGQTDADSFVIADPEAPNPHKFITLKMLDGGTISNGRVKVGARGYFNVVELNKHAANRQPNYCILESIQAMTIQ
jgi:hypothetical protein